MLNPWLVRRTIDASVKVLGLARVAHKLGCRDQVKLMQWREGSPVHERYYRRFVRVSRECQLDVLYRAWKSARWNKHENIGR